MRLRIASRKSDLAKIQAFEVAQALQRQFPAIEIDYYFRASLGDQNQNDPLWQLPEKGVFTEDFSADLSKGAFDLVVHSWKDLPLEERADTMIAATLPRADQRDLLLLRRDRWKDIKRSQRLLVLSSSPRREYNLSAWLREALPFDINEICFEPVRGNVPTRMRKLMELEADGLIVAKAALDRILSCDLEEFLSVKQLIRDRLKKLLWMVLPLTENPTAAAQGALALEIRRDDLKILSCLQKINSPESFASAQTERKLLQKYGGGCHQKIGISHIRHSFGEIIISRGIFSGGEFHQIEFHQSPEAQFPFTGCWPASKQTNLLFSRRPMDVSFSPEVLKSDLWVARADALPPSWTISPEQLVWTAGLQTWQKLARRGIWVHGSAESWGEGMDNRIETLLHRSPRWLKLTHSGAKKLGHQLATYELVPTELKPDFSGVSHYFWTSGSQFDRALALDRRILQGAHGCGPGHTYEHLLTRLGPDTTRVRVYLSFEQWQEEICKLKR